MSIAVFSGSFDPFTTGHLDILRRSASLFNTVVVAVLNNVAKRPVFSIGERKAMIESVVISSGLQNVKVEAFNGLLVDFAKAHNANYIVRGLRSSVDFEYELSMDQANRHLDEQLETIYLFSKPKHAFISSGIVREIGAFNGDIHGLVPDCICKIIAERLKSDEQ